MIALRRSSAALREGDLKFLAAPATVLAFEREMGRERVRCYFNLDAHPARCAAPGAWDVALGLAGAALSGDDAALPAYSALILRA